MADISTSYFHCLFVIQTDVWSNVEKTVGGLKGENLIPDEDSGRIHVHLFIYLLTFHPTFTLSSALLTFDYITKTLLLEEQ